jgi:hypothetical protein
LGIPNDLAETEVGNLDQTDSTGTLALDELALIGFVFVIGPPGLGVTRWYEWGGIE